MRNSFRLRVKASPGHLTSVYVLDPEHHGIIDQKSQEPQNGHPRVRAWIRVRPGVVCVYEQKHLRLWFDLRVSVVPGLGAQTLLRVGGGVDTCMQGRDVRHVV